MQCEACDALFRSVGQTDRKLKYGCLSVYTVIKWTKASRNRLLLLPMKKLGSAVQRMVSAFAPEDHR